MFNIFNSKKMNDSLSKQKEFQEVFGQPVLKLGEKLNKERMKLRLNLALEELSELAEAMGISYDYVDLLAQKQTELLKADKNKYGEYDEIGILDALADIQVIHNGTIHERGMAGIFDEAYDKVHDSNMSKVCATQEEAEKTIDYYTEKGNTGEMNIEEGQTGDKKYFVVKREDDKVLKSINYTPVDLKSLFNK